MNKFAYNIGHAGVDTMSRTENGALTHSTSESALVDFFFVAGASRGKNITEKFARAYAENKEVALRTLLWTRDARGGAGERQQFRDLLLWVEQNDNDALRLVVPRIPELGRFDDLLVLNSPLGVELANGIIYRALFFEKNGLCAKWMPRQGPDAVRLRNAFGVSPKRWRKTLVTLTNVVETQMCAGQWELIEMEKIPSLASTRYRKALQKHVPQNFQTFAKEVKERTKTVKAGAVYPYDVIKPIKPRGYYNEQNTTAAEIDIANAQWANLPDYVGEGSFLPIVDVSGSMEQSVSGSTSAMDVAVSLGLYLSERNKSAFKDITVNFSDKPQIHRLSGTLSQRLSQLMKQDWGGSTNLQAAFKAILDHAVKYNVPQYDMPKALIILSDMQFNSCIRPLTNHQAMEEMYRSYGYEIPNVVFWHLNARNTKDSPVTYDKSGTALVSGFSPAIMKTILSSETLSPLGMVFDTVMVDRYRLAS